MVSSPPQGVPPAGQLGLPTQYLGPLKQVVTETGNRSCLLLGELSLYSLGRSNQGTQLLPRGGPWGGNVARVSKGRVSEHPRASLIHRPPSTPPGQPVPRPPPPTEAQAARDVRPRPPRSRRCPAPAARGVWLAAGKHRGKCLRRHVNQLLSMPRHTPVSPRRQPRASPGATGEVLKVGAWSSFSLSPRGRVMALGPGQGCDHRAWWK